MLTPQPPRWRLNPRIRLTWRDWGHDSVAFESLSGTTHQFDPLAAAVLSWFEERACSLDELATALVPEDADAATAADLSEAIAAAVSMLVELAWVEPDEALA